MSLFDRTNILLRLNLWFLNCGLRTISGALAFSQLVRWQFAGRLQSVVPNKLLSSIVMTSAESYAFSFLTTNQKLDYLSLCSPFPFQNCLGARTNNMSNIKFSKSDGFLSKHM